MAEKRSVSVHENPSFVIKFRLDDPLKEAAKVSVRVPRERFFRGGEYGPAHVQADRILRSGGIGI